MATTAAALSVNAIFTMIQANVPKIIEHQEAGNRYTMFPGEVCKDGIVYSFLVEVLEGQWQIKIERRDTIPDADDES